MVLLYSSGIPILYAALFLFMLITYWVDKLLILRFYKSPPKYDLYMSKIFNMIILFGIFLHFCFAIWIYGNPDILSSGQKSFADSLSSDLNSLFNFQLNEKSTAYEVVRRITLPHNIILFVFLCSMLIVIALRILLLETIFLCCCKVFKNYMADQEIFRYIRKALPIQALYKYYQIRKMQVRKLFFNKGESNKALKEHYINGLKYDRYNLYFKLKEEGIEVDEEKIVNSFDKYTMEIFRGHTFRMPFDISGDVSYNLAFSQDLESFAYYDLIVNSKIIKGNPEEEFRAEMKKIHSTIDLKEVRVDGHINNEFVRKSIMALKALPAISDENLEKSLNSSKDDLNKEVTKREYNKHKDEDFRGNNDEERKSLKSNEIKRDLKAEKKENGRHADQKPITGEEKDSSNPNSKHGPAAFHDSDLNADLDDSVHINNPNNMENEDSLN